MTDPRRLDELRSSVGPLIAELVRAEVERALADAAARDPLSEKRLTVAEAAQVVRKHPKTIRCWIRAGDLPAERKGKRGPWLVRRRDLLTCYESIEASSDDPRDREEAEARRAVESITKRMRD